MSGICGVWAKQHQERLAPTLGAVSQGLALTPGERSGREIAGEAGVAVQGRFRGQQIHRNDRLLLACDADLVNAEELARAVGHSDPTQTAVLLAALYERDGERFVERLRGAFSLVIWDGGARQMMAAVDGFGIKRLAWFDDGKVLLIASRVDALRGGIDTVEVNPRAIVNVVNFSANLAPETVFRGVRRLSPGTILRSSASDTRSVSYWDMRYGIVDGRSERELSRALEAVVERSVALHSAGETNDAVGAFLSGGTDSSTVLGMMTRTRGARVKAFSIGFDEDRFSELEYADIAARAFGAEHHKYLVTARDCLDSLTDIVRAFDEPFGNASAIPTYFCARLAADHEVRVLLAGDGGDELFGGNERYATEKIFEIYHSVPRWLQRWFLEPFSRIPIPNPLTPRAAGYIRRANLPGAERMFSFHFLRAHPPGEVFHDAFLEALDGYDVLSIPAAHYAKAPARDHLDRLLFVDVKITLADNDLPKVTCVSELAGVQTRFPYLDREVAEFSGSVPSRLKVKGFQKRYLFKRAFSNLLPPQILRKRKHGFGIPVALWLKSDPQIRALAHDTLLSQRAKERGYFRSGFIEELFHKHDVSGGTYYGDVLWTFLMVELWHTQVMDQPARNVA